MKPVLLRCLLLTASSLILSTSLSAQTFTPVVSGSQYLCGKMPDGSRLLFVNNSGNYEVIDSDVALKRSTSQLKLFQKRSRRLREIKRNLRQKINVAESSLGLAKIFKELNRNGFDGVKSIPKTNSEKRDSIDNVLELLASRIDLTDSEIAGIKNCINGEDPPPGQYDFNGQAVVVKDGTGLVVGALVTTRAKDGQRDWTARWFCVTLPGWTGYAPRLFSVNPCVNAGLSDPTCPSLVAPGLIGYIEPFTTYGSEPIPGSLENSINKATESLASGPISGRVRGNTGTHGTVETDRDRCD